MTGLYSLRRTDASVRLAAVLFMLVLGYAYIFAFFMVKDWAGLTPGHVAATYAPAQSVDVSALPEASSSATQPLDLSGMDQGAHRVDTRLLIQDSHIHIMIYAIVAALQALLILGLEWNAAWRNTVIIAAFGSGALDFSGQWLIKAGIPGFAWLTIASGWLMSAVYVVALVGTLRAALGRGRGR
ncbi:MAG: hypothetical protein LJF04_14265 [Gemmatimonadetes bacterium]|nr:hypothetical protein [Gemmatimonadota bacterium]